MRNTTPAVEEFSKAARKPATMLSALASLPWAMTPCRSTRAVTLALPRADKFQSDGSDSSMKALTYTTASSLKKIPQRRAARCSRRNSKDMRSNRRLSSALGGSSAADLGAGGGSFSG